MPQPVEIGDTATGLLLSKTYPDAKATLYAYAFGGALERRTWPSDGGPAVTTTYAWDEDTGALTGLLYSDSTPDVTFDTYDRLGRLVAVTDGAGTHTSTFNAALQLEKIVSFGPASKAVAYGYETGPSPALPGRSASVSYGPPADPNGDYLSEYSYDTKGRLNRVTGPGLPAYQPVVKQ